MAHPIIYITVRHGEKTSIIEAESGTILLDILKNVHEVQIDAACGGKGTCGKCKVRMPEGNCGDFSKAENQFLSPAERERGFRLACQVTVKENSTILVDGQEQKAQILHDHGGYTGDHDPVVKKKYLSLSAPSLSDQRDDLTRVLDESELSHLRVPLALKKELPSLLRDSGYQVTAVYLDDTLITVEGGDTTKENYGIAVDIGTTTVVVHLLDLFSGEILDTASGLNRQKVMGADVISRIEYCMKNHEGLQELQNRIVEQLAEMILELLGRNSIHKSKVYSLVAAGNTTMLHLFSGVDPSGIAAAPFVPGFLAGISFPSRELGNFPLNCVVSLLPSISGYVGGDIVAGILASKMYERDELSILIDIGTNGEIVLGNREQLYCCSTAAGPAFEGAHISCGMGGIGGALDAVRINGDTISYTTIHNSVPAGICGSGIIDTVAALISSGVVEGTGRIYERDEVRSVSAERLIDNRLVEKDGPAFLLVEASESRTHEDIVFTQRDIREVQLAKAAISAGVDTLLHESGTSLDEIGHLFIAGGFGSYISKESAAVIGLIPAVLLDRTEFIGNSAGQGAMACSFSRGQYRQCDAIVSLTNYIELSSNPYFQERYMENMLFPEAGGTVSEPY